MFKSITNISAPKKWMYTPKEGEQFFFMHIPKTGGTTFRKMLTNHFPEGSYYPTQEDLIENGGKYLNQKALVEIDKNFINKNLVIGHYDISLLNQFTSKPKVLAFFRNPIERILSHIRHLKKNTQIYMDKDYQYIVDMEISKISNVQARSLGYRGRGKNFIQIKENINHFTFVGLTEYFSESIQLCNKKLNWKLENIAPLNINKSNFELESNSKILAKISTLLGPEIHVYNLAFNKFLADCEECGIKI